MIDKITKLFWKSDIKDIEDVKLFFCHIIFDLSVNFMPNESFDDYIVGKPHKKSFSKGAAKLYDGLLDKCWDICHKSGIDIYLTSLSIFDEYDKWYKKDDNLIKELPIIDKTGKRIYDTKFKGEVPTFLMIYKVSTDTKIGYGILKSDDIYKCFNNDLLNSFFTSFNQSDNCLKVIPRK